MAEREKRMGKNNHPIDQWPAAGGGLRSGARRKRGLAAACICTLSIFCASFPAAGQELNQVLDAKGDRDETVAAIKRQFAGRPLALIDSLETTAAGRELSPRSRRVLRRALSEMIGPTEFTAVVSRIAAAEGPRVREVLSGALADNEAMLPLVRSDASPVLGLLQSEELSLQVMADLAQVLSSAGVSASSAIIRDKIGRPYMNDETRFKLYVSLVRLGDPETLSRYVAMLASDRFTEQNEAVWMLARSASPRVMKYIADWFDLHEYPNMLGHVDPPFRYVDVAVRFAEHFRSGTSGPVSLGDLGARQYTEAEITEARAWWEDVQFTEPYQ